MAAEEADKWFAATKTLRVGDGCGSIGAVITILQNDAAKGTITNDQADSVLGWLYYFRDILDC
jgi:hypothetical protein